MRHEFEIYFWIRFSGLAGNVDVKGLDKAFPESRKLGNGTTKVTGLGRMGQNLYHRGHRGLQGGSVVTPFPCLAKAARHGCPRSRQQLPVILADPLLNLRTQTHREFIHLMCLFV